VILKHDSIEHFVIWPVTGVLLKAVKIILKEAAMGIYLICRL
jgi:hypothetical protein